MRKLTFLQRRALSVLQKTPWGAGDALPEELFLFVSSLTPIPNVDLLVVNEQRQILLARRNDPYYEKSWHIPGGCIRFGETMLHRVEQTALVELGTCVDIDPVPVTVRDVLRGENANLRYPNERGHNITILFNCRVPAGWKPNNGTRSEMDAGYLKWFSQLPPDFMAIQQIYGSVLDEWR